MSVQLHSRRLRRPLGPHMLPSQILVLGAPLSFFGGRYARRQRLRSSQSLCPNFAINGRFIDGWGAKFNPFAYPANSQTNFNFRNGGARQHSQLYQGPTKKAVMD